MIDERKIEPIKGWGPLFLYLAAIPGGMLGIAAGGMASSAQDTGAYIAVALVICPLIIVGGLIGLSGCMAVAPNHARVLLLFGEYRGSVCKSGFYWVNPFFSKRKISLRVRNFETGTITTPEKKDATGNVVQQRSRSAGRPSKVNDRDGNPIDISAVVVWKVVDTAEALFHVDDFDDFVAVQSEAALRNLASRHPYDSEDHELSLRGNTESICEQLRGDIQERLDKAGVEVVEARISHLAYAPEIAAAMLQRQQAQAVVAARTLIVDGAVGMVEMALERISKENIVELDNERRAAMVSNLLVVLCGDHSVQPVVNAGTLYNWTLDNRTKDFDSWWATQLASRDSFLLRTDPKVLDAMRRWASDDLRSVNAQIEFVLRQALRTAGRLHPLEDHAAGPNQDKESTE